MKRKHVEMMMHIERFIDRHRWPDYVLTKADFRAFLRHESEGIGEVPEPLKWAKKSEEITLQQYWHDMASWWASRSGWFWPWRDNLSRLWASRNGTNVMMRKLLSMKRLIDRKGGFLDAMMCCSYFSEADRQKYLAIYLQHDA